MSLQVWLPLNGSLENQGVKNVTVTVNGATSYTNGKLGQALSCNGSSFWDIVGVTLGAEASIACWTKTTVNGKMSWTLVSSISDKMNLWESNIYTLNTGDSNNNPFQDSSGNTIAVLHDGNWHHFVVTFGSSIAKLYIDGVYRGTAKTFKSPATTSANTIRLGGGYGNGHTYDWNGMLQDFRVYNHCLNESEIKRLSKGLMLHYPLSKNGWGRDNLIRGTKDWNLWSRGSGTTYSGDVVTLAGTTADWSAMLASAHFDKSLLDGMTLYTWSFEYKSNADAAICSYISGTTTGIDVASAQRTKYGVWKHVTLPSTNGEWKHYVLSTRTFSESQMTSGSGDVTCCYIQFYIRTDNVSVDFRRIKFEKGDIATPWSPNPADSITSLTDFNSNIEYDVSGFNNNGTRMGTIDWTSDTPRHRVSTLFNGTNSFISRSTILEGEPLTVSVWVKTLANKSTSQMVFYDSGSELGISFYQGCIIGLIGNSTASTGSKCTLGSSYIENGWNHIVVVKTGTGTRDIYCNRVKLTATSNDRWTSFATGVRVGTRETSSPLYFNGQLSDLRVYATAFTQTDVDNLYNGGDGI